MKKNLFNENKLSRLTECLIYILMIHGIYRHSREALIKPVYSLIILFGFILFLVAKFSVIKKGVFLSFGCEGMTTKMKAFYFTGYVFKITGYFATFSIVN